jgi:NO-binding membrane sensor protein with MHYT domain
VLDINHFTYGFLTPSLAYLMSVIGSFLALQCTQRAHAGGSRIGWLAAASVALGGAGIWVMHFIAMLGFSIKGGVQIRFDVPLTLLSALIAIVVVGVGLFLVGLPERPRVAILLLGGAITGCGVAAMHYTGMAAMNTDATISYNVRIVALSVVVAVVAATAALWFTLRVEGLATTIGAALIMGVAVTGMHYTGMASMRAHAVANPGVPPGTNVLDLLTPLIVVVSLVTTVLMLGVATTEPERADPRPATPDELSDTGDLTDAVRLPRGAHRYTDRGLE